MENLNIEESVLDEWQQISNLVADFCNVPTSLIMRQHNNVMEVVVGSDNPSSPYKRNEKEPLTGSLYCEQVVASQKPLNVPNALIDPDWDHNPDLELGMIFYYGVPINMSDGQPFGTLCVLDREEKQIQQKEVKLIKRFARSIELMLELIENREILYHQSITDDLTGIPNRRHFLDCLNKEFQRGKRHGTGFSVAMIDLDHFKRINDDFGHDVGDSVLAGFTKKIQDGIRAEDTFGRIGGEEFALLMPMTHQADALHLLERFREMIEKTHFFKKRNITFSAGVVECSPAIKSSAVLLSQADHKLYQAKQQGRNKICG